MNNCLRKGFDRHSLFAPGLLTFILLLFASMLNINAQDHKPTRAGKILIPENYQPKEIADIFAKGAVTYDDMKDRAKHFKFLPGQLVVATRLDVQKKEVRARLKEISWSSVLGNDQLKVNRLVLAHELSSGPTVAIIVFDLPAGLDVFQAMKNLEREERVLWSSPNFYVEGDPRDYTPNDPRYNEQYHHPLMKNNLAWDITKGSANVVVAVTDDGVETTHLDLSANIWTNPGEIPGDGIDNDNNGYIDDVKGWDFDNNNNNPDPNVSSDDHGTHVAGIVAARMDNSTGVSGVAGMSKVMALQFYGTGGSSWTAALVAESFAYAVDNGAKILNTSYNIDGFSSDPVFIAGAQYVLDNGVLYFNSAGNNNELNPPRQVITQSLLVANTTQTDTRSSSSNYGNGIDVSAPGTSILSTITGGAYANFSGTSMATPAAAGAAALIWSAFPNLNSYQVAALLLAKADDISTQNPSIPGLLGSGRVNTFAAITSELAAPRIKAITGLPANGGGSPDPATNITVAYNQVMDPVTVNNPNNFELRGAGVNNTFNDADDVIYTLTAAAPYRIGTNFLSYAVSGSLPCGNFKLTIFSNGLKNPFGTALDGDGNGTGGDNYVHTFSISQGYFLDDDGDGYGTGNPIFGLGCQLPQGYAENGGDCNDADPLVHPGRPEICNGVDDNCDGLVDFVLQDGGSITFQNNAAISIPTTGSPGVGSLYPSVISVNGVVAPVYNVSVKLKKLNHSWVNDVDILLVGPGGEKFIILSDVGSSSSDPVNADLTLTDTSSILLNANSTIATGIFKPSNVGATDVFPAPAPAAPYNSAAPGGSATFASVFRGINANGNWSLYVVDDAGSDGGSISEGWELVISTLASACASLPAPDVSVTQPTCLVAGSIIINSPVATGNTYSIGGAYQLSPVFNALPDGDYQVTVKDALNNISPATTVTLTTSGGATWFRDFDDDGFGTANISIVSCVQPAGYVTNSLDCNDNDDTVYPGAPELCDGKDNNCDGSIDEDNGTTWYQDNDGDGFGDVSTATVKCTQPAGYVTNDLDCNDNDDTVYPGAPELCDGKDNDCDGSTDEDGGATWFRDFDDDGFGNLNSTVISCVQPAGYVTNDLDCNDNDDTVYPGAPELCDGKDNDCDGSIDEDGGATWFRDFDDDGFGNLNSTVISCVQPAGYVTNDLDCNDNDDTVYPGAPELCDGKDNDCDGSTDENMGAVWYVDNDGDGFGSDTGSIINCTQPAGYVANSIDCDDSDDTVYPGAPELCDGIDNNCDGITDGTPSLPVVTGLRNACEYVGTGQPLLFVASSIGADSYQWTVPSTVNILSGQGTDSLTVTLLPGFTALANKQLRVIAANGCGTSAMYIHYMLAQAPGAMEQISGITETCSLAGTGATASYSIPPVTGANGYVWTLPAGANMVQNNGTEVLISFNAGFVGGEISVIAVNPCGQSVRPRRLILTAGGSPVSQPGLIRGSTNACVLMPTDGSPDGIETLYSVSPVNGATGYIWTVPTGAAIVSHPAGAGVNDTVISVRFTSAFAGGQITVAAIGQCSQSAPRALTISSALIPGTPGAISSTIVEECPNRVYRYSVVAYNTSYHYWTVPPGATILSGQGTSSIDVNFSFAPVSGNISVTAINGCATGKTRSLGVSMTNCTPPLPVVSSAVKGNEEFDIAVYPNPNNGNFRILSKTRSLMMMNLKVFDLFGRTIWQGRVLPGEQINIGNKLPKGTYLLQVAQENQDKTIRMIIH